MDQLNAMRAFIRVAETGSFSVAARTFGSTQATMSKRVAALEEILGVKLLIRSSREQSLTEAGRDYFQQCIPILEAIDEAESHARCHTHAPRGLLRITASVDFARQILSPLLDTFMQQYPDIFIDLILSNYQLDMIAGSIDIAIRSGNFEDSSLIAKPLCRMSMYLTATPEYLAKHGVPSHPNDLIDHECLLYSPVDNPRRWYFKEGHKTMSVIVNGRFQCDNGNLILDMALASKGITMLPYWMMHSNVSRGDLVLLLPEYAMPATNIKMVYPDRKHLPLKTRSFLDFMAKQTKNHPAFDSAPIAN